MTDILIEATPLVLTLEVTAGLGGPQGVPGEVAFPMTIRDNLAIGTGIVKLPIPFEKSIVAVMPAVATPPIGSDIVFDVKVNGTTIFPTATKPTIPAGQTVGAVAVPDLPDLQVGDAVTIDVVAVGITQPGAFATVNVVVA